MEEPPNSYQPPSTDSVNSGVIFSEETSTCAYRTEKSLRVAVIGAGPSGLCAARHLLASSPPISATVFEQNDSIGGTWVYTDAIGKNKYGLPISANLYKNLKTNLPKECMTFPNISYPELDYSYIDSSEVLNYLNNYADQYELRPHIRLNHHVKAVAPVGNGWSVTFEDLPKKQEEVQYFNAVMVCSGPHSIPVYPSIEGMAKFSGLQLHSKAFRTVDNFKDKSVLVIGLGPSGIDISFNLSEVCKKVYLSHNKSKFAPANFPENIILKPCVESLHDKTINFMDSTSDNVDAIIYCTGYTFNFPFLSKDCKIVVDQYVSPLYKHFINIEHPTMCIIGLPKNCPHLYMVDYQVRCFVNILKREASLPDKEKMLEDTEQDIKSRQADDIRKKDYHKLWRERTDKYFKDLAELGNLEPIPSVQLKMFTEAFLRGVRNLRYFRNDVYRIIDDENFEVHNTINNDALREQQ